MPDGALGLQLDVPVAEVDDVEERFPGFVESPTCQKGRERITIGTLRGFHEAYSGLFRGSPPLLAIASQATGHHIFPSRRPPFRPWNDMVQIQIGFRIMLEAILAGVIVANQNVDSGEPDLPLRHVVVAGQQNDPRNPDLPVDQADCFVMNRRRKIAPTCKIEQLILLIDRFGDVAKQEAKSVLQWRYMNRKKGAIQD